MHNSNTRCNCLSSSVMSSYSGISSNERWLAQRYSICRTETRRFAKTELPVWVNYVRWARLILFAIYLFHLFKSARTARSVISQYIKEAKANIVISLKHNKLRYECNNKEVFVRVPSRSQTSLKHLATFIPCRHFPCWLKEDQDRARHTVVDAVPANPKSSLILSPR